MMQGEFQGYAPEPGWELNPLSQHRNIKCPCGSRRKAKKCCGQMEVVTTKAARQLRKYLKSGPGRHSVHPEGAIAVNFKWSTPWGIAAGWVLYTGFNLAWTKRYLGFSMAVLGFGFKVERWG